MFWMNLYCRQWLLVALGSFALVLCGCQPKIDTSVTDQLRKKPASPSSESEADYGCSYFYFLWGRHAELLLRFEEALEFYQKALVCDEKAEIISEKVPILLLRLERTDEASI